MIFPWGRPSPSTIRPLRAEAAADCARIHASGFAYPWSQSEMESLIGDPNAVGTAALDPANAKLRGFVLSRLAADEAEILTIAVDRALRKAGVGRDLLRAHLTHVAAAGATRIFLEVDEHNAAALALYARFGFAKVGERKGYYKRPDGGATAALVMRRDLS
ncbi:MAG: ribosomal protein S18-alanine N-acetyltransferase [Pseudomonadota bacterium]|nr:ribosomal protein S18-alanine N-acetyltransferase [Pseudomonadota bacterium]